MDMNSHFAAVSTLVDGVARYKIIKIGEHHGATVPEVVQHFSEQAYVGCLFEAADDVDAEVLATTVLPHPRDVVDFYFVENAQLNQSCMPG